MLRACAALVFLLVPPGHCGDKVSNIGSAFKFVGGFLGVDQAREERPNTCQGLSVIGAGFPRTGTKSTETALNMLGHKIYDARSMIKHKHTEMWIEAARQIQNGNTSLVSELLTDIEAKGYTATLDRPINLFAKTLAELRPTAKVLFTHRDLDGWYRSFRDTVMIFRNLFLRPWTWLVDLTFVKTIEGPFGLHRFDPQVSYPENITRTLPWFDQFRDSPLERNDSKESIALKESWIEFHESFRRELEASLPPSRFLAFNVRQGWGPLLAFLEIDDPALAAEPFPRVNDADSLRAVGIAMKVAAAGLPLWVVLALYVVFAGCRQVFRCVCGSRTTKRSD